MLKCFVKPVNALVIKLIFLQK